MQTGENEQALRKITDFTRLLAIVILILHFYYSCYLAFQELHLTHRVTDHILINVYKLSIFRNPFATKSIALLFLIVSLIGTKGKKDEKMKWAKNLIYAGGGLLVYFLTDVLFFFRISVLTITFWYVSLTSAGFLSFLSGVSKMFRIIKVKLNRDIFNEENETFPQEERKLENEYSINLPARYNYKGKKRDSWINVINPFRSTLICGSPGSGKSYFVIRHIIDQHIKKGFSMFIYDFKFDDLSVLAYNALLKYQNNYKVKPTLWIIDFDKIYHRCNPVYPEAMFDLTDAMESARTFMLGLNREWVKKQGDFFVESPINFVTALIWFLRKYKDGIYCTIPHAIELAQVDYKYLFALLKTEPEIEVLINPFISAWKNEAYDQLEGQIASAKISMARLVSPSLYYVLSGNDFTLDINNPVEPKIVCMGNNPQKLMVYGAVLSLYVNRMLKIINQKGKLKSSLIFDEYPTLVADLIPTIATGRSNLISCSLGIQDASQLRKDYGREQADVIMSIVGNIIAGQVTGDTAKQLSERFGKIMQERTSISMNSQDTSISKSTQLDFAIPASKISTLSSGEFVGLVADDPNNKIKLKVFHNEIINNHDVLKHEADNYKQIPQIRHIDSGIIMANYLSIKSDIEQIIRKELPENSEQGGDKG